MIKNNSQKKNYLHQVVLAAMLSGFGAYASAAELTLSSGSVALSSGGATQTATVDANGLASKVTDIAAANYGIPNIGFAMVPTGLTNGVYTFKLGVAFDDDNTDSRVEVYIPSLVLTVSDSGAKTNGTLDPSTKIRVLARQGSTVIDTQLNIPATSPIKVVANYFSFDMGTVLGAVAADHASIQAILNTIKVARNFTYTIALQESTAGAIRVGVNGGSFTAFPRIQTSCVANTASQSGSVFKLQSNALAANFTAAYAIQGQYSVTGATGSAGAAPTAFTEDCAVASGGGTTTTPPVVEDTTTQNNTNETVAGGLTGTTVSPEVVTQVNDAITSGATLAENTASGISNNTVTTTAALTALTSVNASLENAGTAAQKNAAVDTQKAASTMESIATTLQALNTSRVLTDAEKTQIDTLASSTIDNAANLVGANTSTADILAIVTASANILAQAATATNSLVSEQVVTKVTALAAKAVASVLKNLPTSATTGVDLTSPAAVKNLMLSNPSVLAVALAASASLPSGASITVAGVSLTREELIARALGNGGSSAPLTGGLNFQAATSGGFTVITDAATGNMTLSNSTEKYVAASPVSRLVPSTVPEGISYLPNGTAVLVGSGVATELAPTAFNKTGFTSAVTDAGFQVSYRNNGTISIALGNNERFSGAFGFDNLGNASSCGAVSVTSPTGNPVAADYAFVVKCANGPSQRVTPIADNVKFYATIANAGLNVSTDRNTGIITINTVGKFKPSFFVTPLTAADSTYLTANKNSDGIAFRATNANGDGKMDYEIISADGKQLMYGL